MIARTQQISLTKQAKILEISRSCLHYRPKPISEEDQCLMNRIDQLHLEFPFARARMLQALLRQEGLTVGPKHVGKLMKANGV